MEDNWDDDVPTGTVPAKKLDENNNAEEPRKFGFPSKTDSSEEKRPFGRGRPSDGNTRSGFGSRDNNGGDNNEQKRSFSGFNRSDNNNDSEGKERSSFGGFRRNNDENNGERKPYGRRNDDSEGGDRRGGFGGQRRNNDESEGGERKPFRKFNNDENGERRPFNRNNDSEGGRRRFNKDSEEGGEKKGFGNRGFGNRDNNEEGGEKKGFGGRGFGNRDNNDEGGEKKGFGGRGFGNRDNNEEGGEKKGFGGRGFGNRDRNNNEEGGEKKGFGGRGFGNRENNDGGERKGFGGRDKSGGDGERRSFKRDGEDGGERRSFKRDGEDGEKRGPKKEGEEGEAPKREKYIPEDVEETEETLFTTLATGINFQKQNEIKTTLSGTGNEELKPIGTFEEAKFSDLTMTNIRKTKYTTPTAVQKYAIPIILSRRDLMACAQTGSGKTAAFVLPIMKNILEDGIQSSSLMAVQEPQALILSPTRELALQIFHECKKFSFDSMIKTGILYGGVDTRFQLGKLEQGCNILVATPGRLMDVLEKKKISLAKVKYFVLDEADRMLDLGFEKAVREILEKGEVDKKGDRCTFMFSATFPNEIQKLAQDFLHDYLFLAVGEVGGANTDVEQTIHKVTKFDKKEKCIEILDEIGSEKTMIFVEQKKNADYFAGILVQKGYPTTTIHGDRYQSQRETALNDFKHGKSNIIVCTAVAARGLDIEKVNYVINYDLPQSIDEYVHRIGRTGRCGNLGKAISFFDPESESDSKLARPLVRILTQAQQKVPEWLNAIAEDSVGSAFGGNSCSTDLRSKFKSLSMDAKPAPAAAQASNEEESWD